MFGSKFWSQTFSRIISPTFLKPSSFYTHQPAHEDGTECSETSAYKIQAPGKYPQESIQQNLVHLQIINQICSYSPYLSSVYFAGYEKCTEAITEIRLRS